MKDKDVAFACYIAYGYFIMGKITYEEYANLYNNLNTTKQQQQ